MLDLASLHRLIPDAQLSMQREHAADASLKDVALPDEVHFQASH